MLNRCHVWLWDEMDCSSPGSSVHEYSLGKNTGVGCHALLQGIFPTQGLNPGLPYCRQILYHLSSQGSNIYGFLGGTHGKESSCQCRRCRWCGFNPWVRKNPESRKWQHIPVFLEALWTTVYGAANSQTWLSAHEHTHTHTFVCKYPVHIQYMFENVLNCTSHYKNIN